MRLCFMEVRLLASMPQPPNWRTRLSLSVWVVTFDLSGMGDPTFGNATISVALRMI